MHLSAECRYDQIVYQGYKWEQEILKACIEKSNCVSYNAFETNDLIPSLHRLIKSQKQDKKAAMEKWVSKYGFLIERRIDSESWESLTEFWREAEILVDLWDKYQQVTQRDLERMKEWIRFEPLTDEEIADFGGLWKTKVLAWRFDGSYSEVLPESIDEIGIEHYQKYAIVEIVGKMKSKLENMELSYHKIVKTENKKRDSFQVLPQLRPRSLLQAMYLQFYWLLANNVGEKICPVCGKVFLPKEQRNEFGKPRRKDAKYCSLECKERAKKRRQRERAKIKSRIGA